LAGFGTALEIVQSENAATISPDSSDVSGPAQVFSALQKQNEELRLLLLQTETLMRETNHRAKNNLQIVSSLLEMQADLLKDHAAVAALKATQNRVFSMAMIHERLCADSHIGLIDFEEYTRSLLKELLESYVRQATRTRICLHASKVFLNVDQAIACGLIVNELVTNALKYAYPDNRHGDIVVELHEVPEGTVTVLIADTGIGLPDGFDWRNSSSMGLPIVDSLSKQIGATLSIETRPGTTFKILFRK